MTAGMTNEDRMYSVRIAPWHKNQGTNVLMLDSAPERRAERMAAAGHDFIVTEAEVFARATHPGVPGTSFTSIPGWKLLSRSDTNGLLHVGRTSLEVVQNVVGHELFEALSKGADLEDGTGGTVNGGAVCYLVARLSEEYFVNGDDSPIYPYVSVTWAHDGTAALTADQTSVRRVCWNTHKMADLEGRRTGRRFVFRHTKNVLERVAEAKAVISGARQNTAAFVELANELAAIPVSDETREMFVTSFIPRPEAEVISDRVLDNILRERSKVRGIFDSPTIPEAHRNTAYGLVEAGIEYLDHLRGVRNQDTYLNRTLLKSEPLKAKLVPMVRELVNA